MSKKLSISQLVPSGIWMDAVVYGARFLLSRKRRNINYISTNLTKNDTTVFPSSHAGEGDEEKQAKDDPSSEGKSMRFHLRLLRWNPTLLSQPVQRIYQPKWMCISSSLKRMVPRRRADEIDHRLAKIICFSSLTGWVHKNNMCALRRMHA